MGLIVNSNLAFYKIKLIIITIYTVSQKTGHMLHFQISTTIWFNTNKFWSEESSFYQHLIALVTLWDVLRTEYQLRLSGGSGQLFVTQCKMLIVLRPATQTGY